MPAAKVAADSRKAVYSTVSMSHAGVPLEIGTELQELLEPHQLDGLLDSGEASHTKPKPADG